MKIKEKIEEWVGEMLEMKKVVLTHPKDMKNGDYAFFNHSSKTEDELVKILDENKLPEIEKIEKAGKFINFYLSKNFFAESVEEINKNQPAFAESFDGRRKIIVEYTDPNPLKEFHIGHLMSNTIGESISRIIEANGAEIKRANYQGDVGIHIAYAVWGVKNKKGILKDGTTEEKAKYLGECYAFGAISAKDNENLKSEFQEINKKIYEESDEEINDIYKWGRKVSLDYFEMMYEKLGTKFDFYFFESEVGEEGKKIVLEFLKKGVFEENEGAIIFRGEKRDSKLHTRVFINSQGLPVYEAKELALAKIKFEKYRYDKSIVVTANEINDYFKVVLAAMKEIFPDLAAKIKHLSHGMMRLPTGKMSSRTGDVITAESLIGQVKEKVTERLADRDYTEEQKQNISEIVAIGAIKYSVLRQAIGGDIIFDFEKSISFEGDSGPYLQYTAVRANSVLEKAAQEKKIFSKKSSGLLASLGQTFFSKTFSPVRPKDLEATDLERYLYRFPEVVERAGNEYAPHYIVTYLTELAAMFNSFYAKEKIIDQNDPTSSYKIALTSAVFNTLKSGLHLLGIKVPERM